ncbi:MAG: heme-binding protein [Alphaproteobacteria bacterium]|nr:heme-binding protein [Alphaproteobacteria bacterium]
MLRAIGLAAAAALLAGCTVFGIRSGTEEPPYRELARLAGGVEVRAYEPRLYAEATAPADASSPRNAAFRKLFRYITGANRTQAEIAMTIPVETDDPAAAGEEIAMTAPVETAQGDGAMSMRFFLPADMTLETAPQPTDPAVRIGRLAPQTMAVLRFSGSTRESRVAARKRDLMRAVEAAADWRAAGAPTAYFYDPPWTLPFVKRNEVAVPVERTGAE